MGYGAVAACSTSPPLTLRAITRTITETPLTCSVIFGAVCGRKWDALRASVRPEDAILGMRKQLGFFANLRPVRIHPEMIAENTLKPEVLEGVDMVVIRELTVGLYFGQPKKRWESAADRQGVDTLRYSEKEVQRACHVAFQLTR